MLERSSSAESEKVFNGQVLRSILAGVQALTRNSDLLHMLMAMHQRERGATGQEAEPEATPAQQQQEVSCRVT